MAVGTVALLFSSLVGGITNYMAAKEGNRSLQAQAQQMLNNIKTIEDEIDAGRIRMEDALKRIDRMIKGTKGELRNIMETQVGQATKQIKEQYRAGLETAMRDIRTELGQRRLMGSEAGQEVRAKTAKGMTRQANEQAIQARERALNEISKQMVALETEGFGMKEAERKGFEQFRLGALSEIMQMKNLAQGLKGAQANEWLSFLSGATQGGLGQLVGDFLSPDEKQKEMPTGSGLPGQPSGAMASSPSGTFALNPYKKGT